MAGTWKSSVDKMFETADLEGRDAPQISDPIACTVDAASGEVCIVQQSQDESGPSETESFELLLVSNDGKHKATKITGITSLKGYPQTPGNDKCPALAADNHLLLLSPDKAVVVARATGEAREVPGQWHFCASEASSGKVYLADADGAVHTAELPLSSPGFPGKITPYCKFAGERLDISHGRAHGIATVRASTSVLRAICVCSGTSPALLACQGHGLLMKSFSSDDVVEMIRNEHSASGLSYPSALHEAGGAIFAWCSDGIRKMSRKRGALASLFVSGEDMTEEDDDGSPDAFPQDFVGVDASYLYVLVARDFFSGQALRRIPHGAGRMSASAGSVKVSDAEPPLKVAKTSSSD